MNALNFLLTVIGTTPVIVAGLFWLGRYRFGRKVLSFHPSEQVDVVMTTSSLEANPRGVLRATTGIGQVTGLVAFARMLTRQYRNKPIKVHLSVRVTNRLDHDLVLLGGPKNNALSKQLLLQIGQRHPDLRLSFDDEEYSLRVGDYAVRSFDTEMVEGLPASDLALIIVERNPFTPEWRRAILCAGFTSYGTAGAAEYLFEDLLGGRARLLKAKNPRWVKGCCFLAILRVNFVKEQVVQVNEEIFIEL